MVCVGLGPVCRRLKLLPPGDGFGEDGVHHALAAQVHPRSGCLLLVLRALRHPALRPPCGRLLRGPQGRQQGHGHRGGGPQRCLHPTANEDTTKPLTFALSSTPEDYQPLCLGHLNRIKKSRSRGNDAVLTWLFGSFSAGWVWFL